LTRGRILEKTPRLVRGVFFALILWALPMEDVRLCWLDHGA
jgi:hypothetical protein